MSTLRRLHSWYMDRGWLIAAGWCLGAGRELLRGWF